MRLKLLGATKVEIAFSLAFLNYFIYTVKSLVKIVRLMSSWHCQLQNATFYGLALQLVISTGISSKQIKLLFGHLKLPFVYDSTEI